MSGVNERHGERRRLAPSVPKVLTRTYRSLTRYIGERWLGGLHAGLITKGLYLQVAARRYLRNGAKAVLDAGCGPEAQLAVLLATRYPSVSFEAWDLYLDQQALEKTCARLRLNNLSSKEADLTRLDITGGYDLIYSIDVLEHIEDYKGVLDRLVAALRPGGRLFLHVPALEQRHYFQGRSSDWSRFRAHRAGDDHVREGFALGELQAELEGRGLQVVQSQLTFGPLAGRVADLYSTCEKRGVLGIGLIMLPLVLITACLEMAFPPHRGNGLWVEAMKR